MPIMVIRYTVEHASDFGYSVGYRIYDAIMMEDGLAVRKIRLL